MTFELYYESHSDSWTILRGNGIAWMLSHDDFEVLFYAMAAVLEKQVGPVEGKSNGGA